MNVFDVEVEDNGTEYTVFSEKKLRKHLRNLNADYCEIFARKYHLNVESVIESLQYIVSVDNNKLCDKISNVLKSLKYDKKVISLLLR